MEVKNVLNIAKNDAFFSCKAWWNIWIVHHRRHVVLHEINIKNNPSEKMKNEIRVSEFGLCSKGSAFML